MTNPARADVATAKPGWLARAADFLIIGTGIWLGSYISQNDFESVVPLILTLTAFIIMRFSLKRPFHEAFTLYVAIAAFNYYYFFCAKLTGRNPTDNPYAIGLPATDLERLQKDIVFGLILLLTGVKLFVSQLQGKTIWLKRTDNGLLQIVILLAGYSILRSFFVIFEGDTPFNALYYIRTNIEYAVIPFILLTHLISSEKQLNIIYRGMLYTLPLVAFLGIIEFLIHGSAYERSFAGGAIFSRATSTMQNPNNLGAYLGTAMGVYFLYFIKNKLSNLERTLFWPSVPLVLVCLLMTLSRSSILSFFLTVSFCMVFLFYANRKRLTKEAYRYYKNLMVMLIGAGALFVFFYYKYFNLTAAVANAVEIYLEDTQTNHFRIFALSTMFKIMIANPLGALFGYSKINNLASPDNAFANILLRNGIIGFGLFMTIWFTAIKTCMKRVMDKTRERSFLYLVCLYILVFQAIFGFSATINQNFPHNMYFWFTIGVIIWLETPFIKPGMQAQADEKTLLERDDEPL